MGEPRGWNATHNDEGDVAERKEHLRHHEHEQGLKQLKRPWNRVVVL